MMKTYEETIRAVFAGRDAILEKKRNRTKKMKQLVIPLLCGVAVFAAGLGLWRGGVFRKAPDRLPESGETVPAVNETWGETGAAVEDTTQHDMLPPGSTVVGTPTGDYVEVFTSDAHNSTEIAPETAITEIGEASTASEGDSYGIGGHYFCVPVLPQNREIVTTGEKLTDAEAAAYFAGHRDSLIASLSASGVPTEAFRISETGYGHVSYTGLEGERLQVKENFRDYLAYNGDELIAIITLVKENGAISATPSFGAAWFADYNEFLQQHRGEELVYVYANFAEIILTPDGGKYSPLAGILPEVYMEGIEDPYHLFFHPGDVYVP